LLFIHGTFSTAHGAFALIEPAAFKTLFDRYDGRVFAFNHFTLSHDPRRNVEWLAGQLPGGDSLELDIVCHSRGGLVARTIAEQPSVFGLDTSRFKVRRIVFVGVPNSGTLLAHPDHMMKMIDRFTTALNVFPGGAVTETLEAIITAVKVLAHGALKGLQGLASMQPDGEFLKKLNQGAPAGTTRSPPTTSRHPRACARSSPARWPTGCSIGYSRASATTWWCPSQGSTAPMAAPRFPSPTNGCCG
jgi:hypothetical protein